MSLFLPHSFAMPDASARCVQSAVAITPKTRLEAALRIPRVAQVPKALCLFFIAVLVAVLAVVLAPRPALAQVMLLAPTGTYSEPVAVFVWSNTSAASYDFQFSRSGIFDDNVFETFTDTTVSKCLSNFSPGEMVFWRARESNTTWGAPESFTVGAAALPQASPSTPAEGSVIAVGMPVTLEWDVLAGASDYTVEASLDVENFTDSPFVFLCETASTSLAMPMIAAGKKVFWRVRGRTATTFGDWSGTRTFTIGAAAMMMIPAPRIDSFTPQSGRVGTVVTLTGENLGGIISLEFGTLSGTNIMPQSPTRVQVTVPPNAVTSIISLRTSGGTAVTNTSFEVLPEPVPTIGSFAPAAGNQGSQVTVTGTNFVQGQTVVTFGGVRAAGVTVISPTQLTFFVPSLTTFSSAAITVTTPVGSVTSQAQFTILDPTPSKPTIELRLIGATATVPVSGQTATLRERKITFQTAQPDFEAASFVIGTSANQYRQDARVRFTLSYSDSTGRALPLSSTVTTMLPAPLPQGAVLANGAMLPPTTATPLNTLVGDLSPIFFAGGRSQALVLGENIVTLGAAAPLGTLRAAGRYSNQVYGATLQQRQAGLEGARTLTFRLLPDTSYVPSVTPSAQIRLLDPANTAPVVSNKLTANRIGPPGLVDSLVLDGSTLRSDNGTPASVFYDDEYDPLSFEVSTSDNSVGTASIVTRSVPSSPLSSSTSLLPLMRFSIAPNAPQMSSTVFTITARDNRGGTATDQFRYTVLTLAPNVQSVVPDSGAVGSLVTISGVNLLLPTSVLFGTVPAQIVSSSATGIVVRVPSNAQTAAITVTNQAGTSMSQRTFRVVVPTSVSQATIPSLLRGAGSERERIVHAIGTSPNPASDHVTLDFSLDFSTALTEFVAAGESVRIQLFDMLGNLVQEHTQTLRQTPKPTLSLRGIPNGLYVVRMQCGNSLGVAKITIAR
jgi:hypothetical protein